jgi:hypothetical protein
MEDVLCDCSERIKIVYRNNSETTTARQVARSVVSLSLKKVISSQAISDSQRCLWEIREMHFNCSYEMRDIEVCRIYQPVLMFHPLDHNLLNRYRLNLVSDGSKLKLQKQFNASAQWLLQCSLF